MDRSNLILIPAVSSKPFSNPDKIVTPAAPIATRRTALASPVAVSDDECQLLLSGEVIRAMLKFMQTITDRLYADDMRFAEKDTSADDKDGKGNDDNDDENDDEEDEEEEERLEEKFYLDESKEFCLYLKIITDERFFKFYENNY
jgi:hypothetical protein